MEYFGMLTIKQIENTARQDSLELTENDIKVVHYPDCQQLLVWLPKPVNDYDEVVCMQGLTGSVCSRMTLSDHPHGLKKVILDTLSIPPGHGVMNFMKNQEKIHQLHYEKEAEITPDQRENIDIPLPGEPLDFPARYKDGQGRPIPDEDLILRKKALENIAAAFSSKVTFHSTGRDGYVLYQDRDKVARFDYEMGGGNCLIFILFPDDTQWFESTGFPLEEKYKILDHIARMTQRDYTGGSSYCIENNSIIFYR